LVVETGKVDYRHVLSISSTMALMWMVLDFRMDESYDKAEKLAIRKNFPVEIRNHYHQMNELGKIEDFIYPFVQGHGGFLSKIKSIPIFMYGFMLIRGQANTQYRPDLSSLDTTTEIIDVDEQAETGNSNGTKLIFYCLYSSNIFNSHDFFIFQWITLIYPFITSVLLFLNVG
jgi:hypothetical protein